MKSLIQYFIRKRNPAFKLDDSITDSDLIAFAWQQGSAVLRGTSVMFSFRKPKLMLRGKNVKMRYLNKIKWGRFLRLGDGVEVSALGREGVRFGDNVGIGAFSRLIVSSGLENIGKGISIGNYVGIGEFAYLGGAGGLSIGDETIVGQYFSCHPENHNSENEAIAIRHQGTTRKGIAVGRNCWIGSKVTILDGVEIGNGCIIAAGAVVTKSFPAKSIIGGVPAKLLKSRTALKFVNQSTLKCQEPMID